MPFVTGGMMAASAIMGGMQASSQAKAQQAQQEWAEFEKKMSIQKQNRATAKKNALQWQQNKFIAQAANKSRAERDYFLRVNYSNETGEFSRNMTATNDKLLGYLHSKNVRGQTAKQLMRQSLESAKKASVNGRLSYENQLRSSSRKQEADLSRRTFAYNDSIQYMPGLQMPDQSGGIMATAIGQGILQGGMAAYSASQTQSFQEGVNKDIGDQTTAIYASMGLNSEGQPGPWK